RYRCAAAPEARRKLPPAQRRRQRSAGSCVPENDQLRSTGLNPVGGSDSIAVMVRGDGSARANGGKRRNGRIRLHRGGGGIGGLGDGREPARRGAPTRAETPG